MLYDGIVITKKHDVISVVDEDETLISEEEIRSKMLAKQNDPIKKKQKINISPVGYNKLNKIAKDFKKHFVPQMQLSAEQAYWLLLLNPKSEQLDATQTLVEIEAPKELLKHTQGNVYILWELVKHARELRPLDSDLDSAIKLMNLLMSHHFLFFLVVLVYNDIYELRDAKEHLELLNAWGLLVQKIDLLLIAFHT
uniref:Uncharacterized protein n=1 Tax=Tanacetum cinerariifolium TaxID=118510 RepID=A0A6L2MWK8_TANCI|nr:hypothetical protein [Tanacetum cinerariifolium]